MPKIVEIVKDSVAATYKRLNPNGRTHCFELFGYDFLIDRDWTPWIIEVNTNPCLSLSSSYLSRLIPEMLENTFRLTLD